ncbi:hypothetical protein HNQ64_003497 [Prosthecobacter dejongeii]|uniref:Uncharacterized protein n=1 Tax=Prosthecobacter dejongeii TaxID=48465 RepID=A0A7W8DR69_9BACT|nr:hypothetical protein [Prosthecobacter dejongeii]
MMATTWLGFEKGEIKIEGRRNSHLYQKAKDPIAYWMTISVKGVLGCGLCGFSIRILRRSLRSR